MMRNKTLLCILLIAAVLLSGCSFLEGQIISYKGHIYKRLYNDQLAESCWVVSDLEQKHAIEANYGKGKIMSQKAYAFNDPGLSMFILNKNGELYCDSEYNWPTCSESVIKRIQLDGSSPIFDYSSKNEDSQDFFIVANRKDIEALQAVFAEASCSKNWEKVTISYDTVVPDAFPISVQITFDNFDAYFNYGLLQKDVSGQYYIDGDYLSDIDELHLVKGKLFPLNPKAQSVLSKYFG